MGSAESLPAPQKAGAPYAAVRPDIRTFDLLLFRGKDPASSAVAAVQRCFTGYGEYTHVGVAVRGGDLPGTERGRLYVWESTASGPLGDGVPDVTGRAFVGVQLRDYDEVARAYDRHPDTRLAWAPLLAAGRAHLAAADPTAARDPARGFSPGSGRLADLFADLNGTRYDAACCALLGSVNWVCRPFRAVERCLCPVTRDWLFCSELVCLVYQHVGLIPADVDARDALPVDFVTAPEGGTYDADGSVPEILAPPVRMTLYPAPPPEYTRDGGPR